MVELFDELFADKLDISVDEYVIRIEQLDSERITTVCELLLSDDIDFVNTGKQIFNNETKL